MKDNFLDVSSELMENTVPAIDVVDKLDDIISKLEDTEDEDVKRDHIKEFYGEIDSWQVIAAQPKETLVWMQIPMKYYEVKRERSILDRINIFFKRGIWVKPIATERYADIISNTRIPVKIELDPLNSFFAQRSNEDKFYYSVVHLIRKIVAITTESESLTIAIYEKPYGIRAMNIMEHWMYKLEKATGVDTSNLRDSLKTLSFSELIESSEVETVMSKDTTDNRLIQSKVSKK